jgi:2-oxoglutarate ferredoxin oxidoreductase subunit delta
MNPGKKKDKDPRNEREPDFWRKPLDEDSFPIPQGCVHIIKDRCKGCNFCIEFCPNCVLEISEEFNTKGYHPPMVTDQEKCVACKLCELICPEFAIYISQENSTDTEKDSEDQASSVDN